MNKTALSILVLALNATIFSRIVYADDISVNAAKLQAMDKITGQVTEIDVPVGGCADFGSLSVLVRKCVTRSPEETPENTAFIDIVDNYETDRPVNVFKGWMFSSTPAISALEHPIYDVWLLQCYNNPQPDEKLLLNEEQLFLRDSLPMVRPEKIDLNVGEIDDVTDFEATVQVHNENESLVSSLIASQPDGGEGLNDDDFASEGEEELNEDLSSAATVDSDVEDENKAEDNNPAE